MNKKGQVAQFAFVFVLLFIIGGIIGVLSFPEFTGKFFITGLIFAIFGTGAGAIVIRVIFNH